MKNNLKEWSLFINGKVVGRFWLCCSKIDLTPPQALYYSNAPPPPLTVNFNMYSLNTLLATTNPPPHVASKHYVNPRREIDNDCSLSQPR